MEFKDSISFLLSKLAVAHRRLFERHAREVGLHGGQAFVLIELWNTDGLRQVDLSNRLDLSAPTVNKILGGLLEGDFVVRSRFEDDARSTRIFLTDKGRAVREELQAQWEHLEDEVTINLTDTEILMLKQLLIRLLEKVDI